MSKKEPKKKKFWKDKEFLAELASNIAGESVRTSMEYAEKKKAKDKKGKPLVKDKEYWAELGSRLAQIASKITGEHLKKYLQETKDED